MSTSLPHASTATTRTGGCLCGAVRFEVAGPLRPVVLCHCTQCRRSTGHFMAATAARQRDFHLLAGEQLRWYASSDSARRADSEEAYQRSSPAARSRNSRCRAAVAAMK